MKRKICSKTTKNANGTKFRSSNLIPKEVRDLFKKKARVSKSLKSVKSVNKCVSLRRKILDADIKLKKHYNDRQIKEELDIFERAKSNKNVLFNFIKQKQKSKNLIGPFIKNKKVINESSAEVLKKQYESVFSTPLPNFTISDPMEFFQTDYECLET